MKCNILLGVLCASFVLSAPSANALVLSSVNLNGNENDPPIISGSQLGIDVRLFNLNPITFNFTRTPNETMFDFNSIVQNLSGRNWGAVTFSLLGGAFFSPVASTPSGFGSATPGFGSVSSILVTPLANPTQQRVNFVGIGESFELQVGNPFGAPALQDWKISLSQLTGNSFSVVVQASPIPVPGGLVLMLSGLVAAGTLLRRKRAV